MEIALIVLGTYITLVLGRLPASQPCKPSGARPRRLKALCVAAAMVILVVAGSVATGIRTNSTAFDAAWCLIALLAACLLAAAAWTIKLRTIAYAVGLLAHGALALCLGLLVFAGAAGFVCGVNLVSQISMSAAWYAALAGVACYLLWSTALAAKAAAKSRLGWFTRARRFVAAVCLQTLAALLLLVLAFASNRLAAAVRWDPQGEPSDSSMFDSSDCSISDLASVSNAKGDSAGARLAICGWGPFAGMSYPYTVVAITRSRGTHKTREVVFRYEPTTSEPRAWPKMKWLRDDVLSVTVGDNAIEQVSKQRFDVDGVQVRYSLGTAKKPPMTLWERF